MPLLLLRTHAVPPVLRSMFQCTSGRDGGFAVLDLAAADEDAGIVQEIADAGLVPVEVLLPDGTTGAGAASRQWQGGQRRSAVPCRRSAANECALSIQTAP